MVSVHASNLDLVIPKITKLVFVASHSLCHIDATVEEEDHTDECDEMYLIQIYVIKFISVLWQVIFSSGIPTNPPQ
jgi:hypothetical protein